jgi:hypothetical protein
MGRMCTRHAFRSNGYWLQPHGAATTRQAWDLQPQGTAWDLQAQGTTWDLQPQGRAWDLQPQCYHMSQLIIKAGHS